MRYLDLRKYPKVFWAIVVYIVRLFNRHSLLVVESCKCCIDIPYISPVRLLMIKVVLKQIGVMGSHSCTVCVLSVILLKRLLGIFSIVDAGA